MKQNASEQTRLEQLHRLYYNLQHRILPGIILSKNTDELLNSNPPGDGLLSETGTPELAYLTEQAITEEELQKHIAEQEEKRFEMEAFDFEEEVPDFLRDLNSEDDDIADKDFFEDDDAFKSDDEDFTEELFEDDELTPAEDDEGADEQMLQLMAELDEILELHKVKSESGNPDENFLDDTWREAWFDTTLEQIPDRAGYTMKRINQQGYEIILFTFPEPIQVVDAYMAAAIRKPGEPYRYYTLEATVGEEDVAVLAEWKAGGLHRNSGSRTTDVRNTDAFLKLIFDDLNYSY